MQITIIKKDKIIVNDFSLEGKSNFWIVDYDKKGNEYNMLYITVQSKEWVICSNDYATLIVNDIEMQTDKLLLNKVYKVKSIFHDDIILMYLSNTGDSSFKCYELINESNITFGKNKENVVELNGTFIDENVMKLFYTNEKWKYEVNKTEYPVFINNEIATTGFLENGDMLNIIGFKVIAFNKCLYMNNFNNGLRVNNDYFMTKMPIKDYEKVEFAEENDSLTCYEESDYFARAPRFRTTMNKETIELSNPPSMQQNNTLNALLNTIPRILMLGTSLLTGYNALNGYLSGQRTLMQSLPSIVMCVGMLISSLLWPMIMGFINKRRVKKENKRRTERYIKYIGEKRKRIDFLKTTQKQILEESFISPSECQNIILYKKRMLWERKIESDDFLTIRLGKGSVPLGVEIDYKPEDFDLNDDELKDIANQLYEESKEVLDCPIIYSLTKNPKTVIVGNKDDRIELIKMIILQTIAFQNYEDVKLVFMVNNEDKEWDDFRQLPHIWDNNKNNRFFATNADEMGKVSFLLEQIHKTRKYKEDEVSLAEEDYRSHIPYYIIITDCIGKSKNVPIIEKVLKDNINYGFTILILNDGLSNLPNECNNYIMVDTPQSAIINSDLNTSNQTGFIRDRLDNVDINLCCETVSNIPIKFSNNEENLKNNFGFLEMYNVGRVEQLNCLSRWKDSSPMTSLSTPIGVHPNSDLFYLDLHEKYHGPHGLIAGTTGSGKSEFIITYILSLAVNYHPNEVQFVLIDYKGGGLAGAFENKETGLKLPHLIGSITNLDTVEMKRSLASIQSELRKRQKMFNDAKTKLNESTIDIYKYQRLYREGKIDTPMSHLFIISDEFAELKNQQPEFMDQLISTARIGRSLGVHLILATQKPAGVVNDQIWSNSKFKVCLKVQEKSDSVDVIKRPDAAELKQAGRFYLQVGYNEYFALGQSAYCGGQYYPSEKIKKKIDRNLSIVDNIGNVIKNVDWDKKVAVKSEGEELPNILKYVFDVAKSQNIKTTPLWLERIPDIIYVNELMKKYNYRATQYNIKPIIGEYDDPNNQRQALLTVSLNDNLRIYGAPGNGKDLMISSIIYSTIINHHVNEVNFYIVDFGAEVFKSFGDIPHVGDIILSTDEEKLSNLFKNLNQELIDRKKKFSDFNGDYNYYIKYSPEKLPRIVVIVNGFEAFSESHDAYVEQINVLSREGLRYGITFIITANSYNALRFKTAQNFEQVLVLQLNSKDDYASIIGNTRGIYPSSCYGRGIFKIDNGYYEFQTAYPCPWDNLAVFMKELGKRIKDANVGKAKGIATLPNVITKNHIKDYISDLSSIPVGINKESLSVETFDFKKNKCSIICGEDMFTMTPFISSLLNIFSDLKDVEVNLIHNIDFEGITLPSNINIISKADDVIITPKEKMQIYLFVNMLGRLSEMDRTKLSEFNERLKAINSIDNVRIVIVDKPSTIRNPIGIEGIKSNLNDNTYIWIGNNINSQYTLKHNLTAREKPLDKSFGYVVIKSNAKTVKLIDFITDENEV